MDDQKTSAWAFVRYAALLLLIAGMLFTLLRLMPTARAQMLVNLTGIIGPVDYYEAEGGARMVILPADRGQRIGSRIYCYPDGSSEARVRGLDAGSLESLCKKAWLPEARKMEFGGPIPEK